MRATSTRAESRGSRPTKRIRETDSLLEMDLNLRFPVAKTVIGGARHNGGRNWLLEYASGSVEDRRFESTSLQRRVACEPELSGVQRYTEPPQPPQNLSRGQPSAFGHRRQFRSHHVGIDRGVTDPGAETAIAAGDDVVTPTRLA